MAETERARHRHEEHDWKSPDYVDEWISRDMDRAEWRLPVLRRMVELAPFEAGSAPRVLDIGAGYGAVTAEVLRAFPQATVTVQDFSDAMLERASARLSSHADRVRYVRCDLLDPDWGGAVGGPFDLAVSAIAIHNLRDMAAIERVYAVIRGLLVPGGAFLDCDHFGRAGGTNRHMRALEDAGFDTVSRALEDGGTAIVAASIAAQADVT